MKIGKYMIALAASGAMVSAQNGAAPPAEITITPIIYETKYCLGPYSGLQPAPPFGSDITLRISWKLRYENHTSEPMIVPLRYASQVRMRVLGEENVQTVATREDPFDPKAIRALARPEPTYFIVIPSGAPEVAYLGEFAYVRVHAETIQLRFGQSIPGTDLLGKNLEFSIVRDHGLLGQPLLEELQAKWKTYGRVWRGVHESETVTLSIPESPTTADCRKDEKF